MNLEIAKAEIKRPPKGNIKPLLVEAFVFCSVAYGMTIYLI